MDWGYGDEAVWVDFVEAAEDAGFSHTGIDEHAGGAGAKDGECEGDEFDGGSDHEYESVSGLDAELTECASGSINIPIELLEGAAGPCGAVSVIAGVRCRDGGLVWGNFCGVSEAVCDVEWLSHVLGVWWRAGRSGGNEVWLARICRILSTGKSAARIRQFLPNCTVNFQ